MSYYWFNRKEILQKEKDILKKAGEYYSRNKEAIKKKVKGPTQKLVKRRKRQD